MNDSPLPYVLVSGGRDYADPAHVYSYLDAVLLLWGGEIVLIHGAARGLDTIAEDWAKSREQWYEGYPAKWKTYGPKLAGPYRNEDMITVPEHIDVFVCFRGARGTGNMRMQILQLPPEKRPLILLPDGEFWK